MRGRKTLATTRPNYTMATITSACALFMSTLISHLDFYSGQNAQVYVKGVLDGPVSPTLGTHYRIFRLWHVHLQREPAEIWLPTHLALAISAPATLAPAILAPARSSPSRERPCVSQECILRHWPPRELTHHVHHMIHYLWRA